jgi:hypothetical protein
MIIAASQVTKKIVAREAFSFGGGVPPSLSFLEYSF